MAKGLCSAHYAQMRRGDELRPLRVYTKAPCKVKSCRELAKIKGFCHMHWKRFLRGGNMDVPRRAYRRGDEGDDVDASPDAP